MAADVVNILEAWEASKRRLLHRGSRPLRDYEHFAIVDLIFRKDIRIGFRIYLNFRAGKARLDRSDSLDFVGDGELEHVRVMSALPPKADIAESDWHVRFVPKADMLHCIKERCYSIISSARGR